MMDRGTVWNMLSFITQINWEISASSWFYYKNELLAEAGRCSSALRSGSLKSCYFVLLHLSFKMCRPCTCSLAVSAKGGLSHPRIGTAHVSGSHAFRRSIIPQKNWWKCWKLRSGVTTSVNYTLTCTDIFMALKPFGSRVLQGYLVSWHMNDRWENAWIVLYSNCSSVFLCLLRFRYVSRVKSRSGGDRLSWQIFSCPPPSPNFLQTCDMVASSIVTFFFIQWATGTMTRLSTIHGLSGVAYNWYKRSRNSLVPYAVDGVAQTYIT